MKNSDQRKQQRWKTVKNSGQRKTKMENDKEWWKTQITENDGEWPPIRFRGPTPPTCSRASQRVPTKYKNHKERLENTKITKSAWKFQCRLPKFVIDKMKHYIKLWSFEIVPQCHPSSPCPCSSRVGSDHFQFRKVCPAPPSSPPGGPRWTGEEKSKMSCKKTREQQGAGQEKGSKEKGETRTRAKLAMLPVVFTTRKFALDWRGKWMNGKGNCIYKEKNKPEKGKQEQRKCWSPEKKNNKNQEMEK